MIKNVFKFLLLISLFSFSALLCFAQAESNSRGVQKEELPKNIKETLEKSRIEQEKKDHEELLQKAEEAMKLSAELQEDYEKNKSLTPEDKKKLDRLEKLLKKIRKDIGGDDDDEDSKENKENVENPNESEKPSTVVTALNKLRSTSVNLFDELKKTSRFSISVVAIQSSNAILKVIKFLRFNN